MTLAPLTVDTMLDNESYKPKNVLITGGAGFIGSHVTIRLVQKYGCYKVVVFDKLDYCATLNNLTSIQQNLNFKFIKGDILSPDLLMYVLETEQIDTVMHFAAQTHVDNSFGNSLAFTMNNTYGTHVLLEACRNYGKIKRFVNVSTDEVYGETSLGSQVRYCFLFILVDVCRVRRVPRQSLAKMIYYSSPSHSPLVVLVYAYLPRVPNGKHAAWPPRDVTA